MQEFMSSQHLHLQTQHILTWYHFKMVHPCEEQGAVCLDTTKREIQLVTIISEIESRVKQ